MKKAQKIDAFVHRCFAMYGLDFKRFYGDVIDDEEDENGVPSDGEYVELPLVVGGKIDMELLAKAATTLGVETEALMDLDEETVCRWYDKYPYFALRADFEDERKHSLRYTISQEDRLLWAIYGPDGVPVECLRYHNSRVKERLLALLKRYDKVMPGCYHKNADIAKLSIRTNNFTHFKPVKELAESYLEMVDRARTLFYKLWDEELSRPEICEYNFLVSVLGIQDIAYTRGPLYYDIARRFSPVYKREGFKKYSSYIVYRGADMPALWTCHEFYDYPELVEKVVSEFPQIKAEIGKMAMWSENFLCSFAWTDEPYPTLDVREEEVILGALHDLGNDRPPQYHHVYVPKTTEELGGDEAYIERCKKLASPASKGGVKLPSLEVQYDLANGMELTRRLIERFELLWGADNG